MKARGSRWIKETEDFMREVVIANNHLIKESNMEESEGRDQEMVMQEM